MGKYIDLTGQKFTRLLVVKYVGNGKFSCKCDCGNDEVIVSGQSLRKGIINDGTKSCGCLQKEMYEKQKLYNRYDLSGNFGIGYTNKDEEFYFDLEDYDLIKEYCWFISTNDNYVVTNKIKGETLLKLHRFVMNAEKGKMIDHENRIKYDCRKNNLRFATNQENMMNKGLGSNNTSGVIGVSWSKEREKWEAYIRKNKRKFLGYFYDFTEAVIARLTAEKELFGEFAPQRHLFEQYGII